MEQGRGFDRRQTWWYMLRLALLVVLLGLDVAGSPSASAQWAMRVAMVLLTVSLTVI
jgi:hypothetical protein